MKRTLVALLVVAAGVPFAGIAQAAKLAPALDSVYHYYAVQDYDAAEALLEQLGGTFDKGNDWFLVTLEKGDFLLDKRLDFAGAEAAYARLLEERPNDKLKPDVLYRLALAQELQEKYLDAARNYEIVATRYMKTKFGTDALDAIERCFRKNYQDRVAYADGFPITRIELDDRISRNPNRYEPYDMKVQLVNEMIDERLLFVAAWNSDVRQNSDYAASLNEARNRIVFEEWYEREIKEQAEPSERELKKQYGKDKASRHTTPEKVHGYQIVVEARERADSLRALLLSDTSIIWDSVVAEHSSAPDKDRGGDMGMFARGVHPKEIENAAFRLKIGQISKPVKTDEGWVILRVTERQAEEVRPFDEVRNGILVQLRQEKMNQLYDETTARLKREAEVVTDTNAVAENRDTLAIVDGLVIDRAELDSRIEQIPPFYRAQFDTPEGRQRILDQLILEKLILFDAEKRDDWLWNRAIDKLLKRRERMLVDAYRQETVNKLVALDSAQLMADYRATIDDFKEPAKVHAREIVAKSWSRAAQLRRWAVAGKLPPMLEGRALFVADPAPAGEWRETLESVEDTDSLVALGRLADAPAVIPATPTVRVANRLVPDMSEPCGLAGPFVAGEFHGLGFADVSLEDKLYRPDVATAGTAEELARLLGEQLEADSTGAPIVDSVRLGTYVRLDQALPASVLKSLFELEAGQVSGPVDVDGGALLFKVTKKDSSQQVEFSDVAKRFSTAPSRWSGGDMYWLTRDDKSRAEKVVSTAFSLTKGGISQIMKLEDSTYAFVKVEDRKKALTRPFEEVKDKIEGKLRRQQEQDRFEQLKQELRDAADIKVVMTEQDFIFEEPELEETPDMEVQPGTEAPPELEGE